MSSLFFFTGENVHELREAKRRWIAQFIEKYGEDNMIRLDGSKTTFRDLLDEVSVAPFISPKRLVVLEGVMKASKEEIRMLPEHIHPDTIVLFADPKPDKRLAGTKELLAIAEVKEYKPLVGAQLQQWIKAQVAAEGSSIEPAAVSALLDMTGEDQDMLEQELKKLSLHATGKSITKADVEEMVDPSDEGVVWKLSDLLAAGRKQEALTYAHRLVERGGDAYGLWAILLNLLKNTVAVCGETAEGNSDQKSISENTGIHFMAIRSLMPLGRKLKEKDLRAMTAWTVEADKSLKTGGYRSTDESPEELLGLIDRFLLSFPG